MQASPVVKPQSQGITPVSELIKDICYEPLDTNLKYDFKEREEIKDPSHQKMELSLKRDITKLYSKN